jgi:hypothetical protein
VDLLFTVDNGASRTILSKETYYSIPADRRPSLQKTGSLKGAGGKPLKELGEGIFTIELGGLLLQKKVVVAEIEDDGLIGHDILVQDEMGPADILASREVMVLRDVEIPIILINVQNRSRRVFAADDIDVFPMTEAVVDVIVESFRADKYLEKNDVLVEPSSVFADKYPLLMASCLVDISNSPVTKIRVMNPGNEPVTIKSRSHVGQAETYKDHVGTVSEKETEQDNNSQIRRIQIQDVVTVQPVNVPGNKTSESPPEVPSHLTDVYEKAREGLDIEQERKVAEMLIKYQNAFSKNDTDLGLTHLAEHSIDTGDARPVKQAPRRVPHAFSEEEKKAIDQLLEQKVIRKSTSPWASPIVLVRKKNGKVRPCVDYRRLNEVTKNDAFPLPRTQDCLDAMAGSVLFSCFDLTSGYHQIPVKKDDIPKTAFCTKYGLFEFVTLPFGLHTAAATCQRVMELALQGLQWVSCLIYMDDAIVFSRDLDSHLDRVGEVLSRIQMANLKLKPEKCQLLQTEVEFLGHVVSGAGVKPNPMNVAKLVGFPQP